MSAFPTWSLFGLSIRSQLLLPFEPVMGDLGEPDVEVRFGELPAIAGWFETCGPDALQFNAAGTGRFRISGGREVVIDRTPGASDRDLRVFLLGSALGALLHQRGVLPLHANAIVIDGKAIAFMGPSGAGKSTLAAWFQDRGHLVLADDVCAVDLTASSSLALPGVPRLRLWRDALERSGREPGGFEPSFDGRDKFDVPSPDARSAVAAPLAAVYLLEEGDSEMSIDPLDGSQAIEALVANTYRGRCVHLLQKTARHFHACVGLARQVPVHRVKRRKDPMAFELTAQRLEGHAREILARAADPVCPSC